MRKSIFIAVSTCLLSVAAFSSSFARNLTERDLIQVAAKLNKRCPVMVDKETRMDSVTAGPGLTYSYNYTFVNYRSTGMNKQEFASNQRPQLQGQICSSPDMAKFLKSNITVKYTYKGVDGGIIAELPFTRKDCNY